jgi:hypothetical protein
MKKLFVGIPKNLIRIFIAIITTSFFYMIYILNNDQYNIDFLSSEYDHDFESQRDIHPLFKLL